MADSSIKINRSCNEIHLGHLDNVFCMGRERESRLSFSRSVFKYNLIYSYSLLRGAFVFKLRPLWSGKFGSFAIGEEDWLYFWRCLGLGARIRQCCCSSTTLPFSVTAQAFDCILHALGFDSSKAFLVFVSYLSQIRSDRVNKLAFVKVTRNLRSSFVMLIMQNCKVDQCPLQ